MTEQKHKTHASLPAHIVEGALGALKRQFELDLAAEWNAARDSPTIRNAMIPLPKRCRECKKPVAGIGADICHCRGKVEQERCVSNPRNALLELFQRRCQDIAASAALTKFVETSTKISLAHGLDLSSIGEQTRDLLPFLKGAVRGWVLGICPDPFPQLGVLPAWFKDKTGVICDRELQLRLSAEDTEAELTKMELEIESIFEEAKKAAVDNASIQVAQFVPPGRKGPGIRKTGPGIIEGFIASTKRNNPGASIEKICQILDAKGCPPRETEKRAGFSSWREAWNDPKYRNRIKRYISGIQPAARKKRAQAAPVTSVT